MSKVRHIDENLEYVVSEVICLKCHLRWKAGRPTQIRLKTMECPNKHVGFVIETGEILKDE